MLKFGFRRFTQTNCALSFTRPDKAVVRLSLGGCVPFNSKETRVFCRKAEFSQRGILPHVMASSVPDDADKQRTISHMNADNRESVCLILVFRNT